MKKLIALLLSLAMLAGLFACAPSEPEKTSPESSDPVATEPGDVKTIGIAIYAMTADSCVAVVEGVQHAAKERGWKVNLQDANADPSTQADQMNTLINAGVDIIFLNPTDVASLKPSLEAAAAANIPVIGIGMAMNDECMALLKSFVGLDDYTMALGVAGYVAENYGGKGAKMAVITGMAGTDPTYKTVNAIEEALKNTDITVVGEYEGKFDAAEAMAITENLLVSNPDVSIIFSQDHVMAGGAVSAIADAGKVGEVVVVAPCGMLNYLDYIKDGSVEMFGLISWAPMGGFLVDLAAKVFAGEKIASIYYQDPLAVTIDNVDSITEDMFEFVAAR
jgi:ABC-type sugar transport system substrate-binding protein